MSIISATKNKIVDAFRLQPSRSAAVADSRDKVQSIVSRLSVRSASADNGIIDVNHDVHEYVGFIPPTATDLPYATIGSTYLELVVDSAAPSDARKWLLTSAGWVRECSILRSRYIKYFGATNSQFDVTVPSAGIARYTWDTGGTSPLFTTTGLTVGDKVTIPTGQFSAVNCGTFLVRTISALYFEIYNDSAVAEANIVTSGTLISAYLTVESIDDIIRVAGTAATTLIIPTAVGNAGKSFIIRNGSTALCTLDPAGSVEIDGRTTYILQPLATITIASDGANYQIRALTDPYVASVVTADAALSPTAAQVRTKLFVFTPGQARAMTMPTPAEMYAVIPHAGVGTSFEFTVVNAAAATHALTVTAGSGYTNGGHADHLVVAAATAKTFKLVFTSTTAATIYLT